jgi:hypothetical protein
MSVVTEHMNDAGRIARVDTKLGIQQDQRIRDRLTDLGDELGSAKIDQRPFRTLLNCAKTTGCHGKALVVESRDKRKDKRRLLNRRDRKRSLKYNLTNQPD